MAFLSPEHKKALIQSLKHGLENLAGLVLVFVLTYLLDNVIPTLPDGPVAVLLSGLIAFALKYVRANPKIKIPDYVNDVNEPVQ